MLKTRVIAALIFAPAFLGLVWLGGIYLQITCLVMAVLMLWEYLGLVLPSGHWLLKSVSFVLTISYAAHLVGLLPVLSLPVAVPVATLLLIGVVLAQPDPIETSMYRAATVMLGIGYCGGLFAYLARVRGLEQGLGFCAMALFCTWGADTGAYFAGRALGRHKLYPKISPGKTVEGGLGGLVAAVAVAFAIRGVFRVEVSLVHTAALGGLVAAFGVLGDLAASLLKRSVGAKDSGRLIPGHGGVLDRFDGVMFVAPVVYGYVVYVVGVGGAS